MRAIVATAIGGPEVLQVQEWPEPQPGPGQIVIRVAYAGVNFAEVMQRRGDAGSQVPFVPGLEVAGHISQLGEGVAGLHVGQPVAAFTQTGGYAELALAEAVLTYPLEGLDTPIDLRVAAAFPTIVPTAYALLAEVARVRRGESVLVHAAAGGVGTTAAQIARHLGAGLLLGTVGSERKIAYARSFGYDQVVLRQNFVGAVQEATGGAGVDVILESTGEQARRQSLEVLAPLGRLVIFGNTEGSLMEPISPQRLWRENKAVMGFSIGGLSNTSPRRAAAIAQQALELLASGAVRIDITDTLPLEQVAQAHRRLEQGASQGKMVLQL